jgi:surface antigen
LEVKKAILGENVRQIYQQSSITPLEILASSKNFSDFIDRQQYLDRIKDHIQDAANAIVVLKQQLEKDKADAEALLKQQQGLKDGLAIQQAQASQLLADTQGQEANYQAQVSDAKNKLNAIVAARAAAIHSGNLSVSSSGCGGYPAIWCNASQDSLVDDWYYYNRECVSYVAWKRYATGHAAPYGWGNAYQWTSHITHYSNPQPGDVAVWGQYANNYIGYYGHVAYVESNNGGSITFSQYNFDTGSGPGRFSTMTVPVGSEMLRGIGYIR